jgi:type IV pilus assembly protein PilY1
MNTQANILYKAARKCLHAGTAMALAAMTVLCSTAQATDTDVFLGSATADSANVKPNIMFIVDTSGSMGFESDTTPGVSRMGILKPALIDILSGLSNVNVGLMTFNSAGGPVRYPIRYIDASVDPQASNYQFNISKAVQNNSDDAQQDMNNNSVTTNTTQLNVSDVVYSPIPTSNLTFQLIANADDGQQAISTGNWQSSNTTLSPSSTTDIGIMFQNLPIPAGATITAANLVTTMQASAVNTLSVRYQAQAHDDAPLFPATGTNVLSSRTWTTTVQNWTNLPSPSVNQTLTSPDLSQVIQEVINRPGWVTGNNLAFRIQRTAGTGSRTVYSRDGTSTVSRQPRLVISYTLTPAPVKQTMGLRFQSMSIPQGARITNAYVDFTAANTSSDPVTYSIKGERVANSTTFAASSNNITSRPTTAASATWALTALTPWLANDNYQTSDLSPVIQEIVDQATWCGGQSLNLILEATAGSAARSVFSREGAVGTNAPPTLHVEYDTSNLTAGTGCVISTFTSQTNYTYDDAEERNGDLRTTDQDLEFGRYSSIDQKVGIRFREVNVPQGAEITSAYLRFTAEDSTSSSTGLTIQGHDVIDPPTFNGDGNISSRVLTTASVSWSPGSWTDEVIYDSPDVKTIVQEIVNQASWQANNSMAFIINRVTGDYRRAYSFNGNAAKAPRLVITAKLLLGSLQDIGPQTVREQLIEEVQNLQTVASTPTVNVYMEALRYFRGMDMYWGDARHNQSDLDRYGRVSHEDSYTGGTLSQPAGCTPQSLNNLACVDEEVTGSPRYVSPMTDPCQANYIVLLSDGLQNSFSYDDNPQQLVGTCDDDDGGRDCGVQLAEFANRNDQASFLTGNQIIRTDTIAFAEVVPFLEDMAAAGGGDNYTANDSQTLTDAFTAIIAEILSKPTTFIAPTLTISAYNRLFNSSEIYISIFKPELSAAWQGNVKKYYLCAPIPDAPQENCTIGALMDNHNPRRSAVADGHIKSDATSGWDTIQDGPFVEKGGAGSQIQNQGHAVGSRNIYTFTGTQRALNHQDNNVVDNNPLVDFNLLQIPNDPTEVANMINWIRGEDLEDEDGDTVTNETRWVFGDPLHSAAITVNYGKRSGSTDPDDVVTKLFVGTNDGGFRMINSFNGFEEWMFIPPDLMPMQQRLRNNSGGNHVFGMDGSPVAWIFDKDGDSTIEKTADGDFVKIFTGQRRGGRNYFGLDVTPENVLNTAATVGGINPYLMWTINDNSAGFGSLGQTWSKPFRTNILVDEGSGTVKKSVLIFGGGYDETYDNDIANNSVMTPASEGNAIYVVDAETSDLIWSASSNGAISTVAAMDYSIPSDIRLIDMDGNNATDRLYVGDMGGQVWRVDFTGPLRPGTDANTVVGLFATLSDSSLPESERQFMYRPQVALINDPDYSAGEYVAVVLNTGDRENPLAKHVHDRTYVLRDFNLDPGNMGATIREGDLVNVTDNIQSAAGGLDSDTNRGWYIDFKESTGFIGEKGITESQILFSSKPGDPPVYTFNTYTPSNLNVGSACSVSLGQNRTYFINLLNGTGTNIINAVTKDRSKYNDAYGIAADPTVVQQKGQSTVSVGGGSTYTEEPDNLDMGDNLLPVYFSE